MKPQTRESKICDEVDYSYQVGQWLWLLSIIFLFRIVGQAFSLWINSNYLPPYESWSDVVFNYPLLMGLQIVIFSLMIYFANKIDNGKL